MKFKSADIQNPATRTSIEQKLEGKEWDLRILSTHGTFARLGSNRFPEGVFFPYSTFGIVDVMAQPLWHVEVKVQYLPKQGRYGYCVQQVALPKDPDTLAKIRGEVKTEVSLAVADRQAIMNLEPSPSWTVLIDETGDHFLNNEQLGQGSRLGKMVALLCPQNSDLPGLTPGWHAVENKPMLPSIIGNLLRSRCGVIGLTINELPLLNFDLWSGAIRTLMDLIVRLLPISGGTTVTFLVEEHSGFTPENGTAIMTELCNDIKLQLSRIDASRARQLTFEAKVISKMDSPYNGYVDAIANCWGSPRPESKALVKPLIGPCLWQGDDKRDFQKFVDAVLRPGYPLPQEWSQLLADSADWPDNSLIRHYFAQLASQASQSPSLWESYLKETRQHLESKTTDSRLLARQLAWLKAAKPADTALSEELRRSWQALQLVEVNRREARSSDEDFRELVGLLFRSGHLLPQEWTRLLALCARWQGVPAVTQRLDELAESAAAQPPLWESYLEATRQHLESKDIDQRLLGQQIAWLKTAMPADTELTDDLQLLWMTAELAEANHLGKVISDPELKSMFSYLTEHLMDEEPRLVAWATLNLSVAYTNAFDFESAEAIMDIWDRKPMQVLGHQYTGQIQSTLGQLAAFRGDNEEAVPLFDQAISNFAKMSNKLKSRQDIEQTTTYKLIAMLDLGLANTPDFDRVAEHYFNLPPEQAALFVPQDPAQRYKHHVLLRMLVSGDYPQAREAYLSQRQNWLTGAYHPWELIEFYRALLLDGDLDAQLRHLDAAFDIAKAGDATLQVIAAVILGSRLALADGRLDDYQALLDTIADELPDLGERLDVLRAQPQAKLPPLTLAARVLPFNFK